MRPSIIYRATAILGLWLGAFASQAQLVTQRVWEDVAPLSAGVAGSYYVRLFPYQARYLAGGCEGVVNGVLSYPAYLGTYSTSGTASWRHGASNMTTCEQMLMPWGSGTGFTFLGCVYDTAQPQLVVPFLEWFTASGQSRRKRVLPAAQVQTYTCAALSDATGYTFTGFGYDPAGPATTQVYTLTRTDSLGAVQWSRTYAYPLPSTPYPNELLRTARGGYLITGVALPSNTGAKPWLVETDASGQLRRQVTLPVFGPAIRTYVNRIFNNTLPLADGGHYAVAGTADSVASSWGYVACFDTALHLSWTTRLSSQRGQSVRPSRVRQLANGTLQVLSFSHGFLPYLFLTTLSPSTGAILNEQEFTIAGQFSVGVWDWQPLADSSLVVVGSVTRTLTANSQAWIGRYKLVPRLPTGAAATLPAPAALVLYPNPAGGGLPARAGLPAGTGPGWLRVRDALGRLVGQQPVGAGRAEVALPTAGLAPGCYRVEFVPDRADQLRAAATLLVE